MMGDKEVKTVSLARDNADFCGQGVLGGLEEVHIPIFDQRTMRPLSQWN
jgi:hypothetical protein